MVSLEFTVSAVGGGGVCEEAGSSGLHCRLVKFKRDEVSSKRIQTSSVSVLKEFWVESICETREERVPVYGVW